MDQMIEHLELLTGFRNKFTPQEAQVVADYLMGKAELRSTQGVLRAHQFRFSYAGADQVAQMADIALKNPSLLPRVGRYLTLLLEIDRELFRNICFNLAQTIPVERLFLEGELGVPALLDFLFEKDAMAHRALPILEELEKSHPEEVEAYVLAAPSHRRFLPLVYLCTRRGLEPEPAGGGLFKRAPKGNAQLAALLAEDLVSAFGLLIHATSGYQGPFGELLAQACPALLPLWKRAEVWDRWRGEVPKTGEVLHYPIYALWYGGERSKTLLTLNGLAIRASSQLYIDAFLLALRAMSPREASPVIDLLRGHFYRRDDLPENVEAADGLLEQLQEQLGRLGADPTHLCRWFLLQRLRHPQRWRETFARLYGGDRALLQRACDPALDPLPDSGLIRVGLLSLLHGLGDGEALARAEAACLENLDFGDAPREQMQALTAWLRGEGTMPGAVELPVLRRHYPFWHGPEYRFDLGIWMLAGASPLAGRYLAWLCAGEQTPRVELCLHMLRDSLDWTAEHIAAYLIESAGMTASLASITRIAAGQSADSLAGLVLAELLRNGKEAATALLVTKELDADQRLCLFDKLYESFPAHDPDFLIACLGDRSKKLRQHALSFLLPRKDLIERIRPLRQAKKKDVREAAEQLMAAFEGSALDAEDSAGADLVGYCTRNLPRNARKSIAWAFPTDLPPVRWKDGGPADEVVVVYYLSLMLSATTMEVPAAALELREALDGEDLRNLARQLWDQWLSDGAPAKQKGVLLLYGFHAGNGEVLTLQRQIEEWSQRARGAIAATAVWAMALGGSDLALVTVDSIGRKFKNKQVRRAGAEAFAAAARLMGTTPDALGDRIIPTLGFDERGERTIDYGPRQFTAILSPSLTIELRYGSGKTVKSLPKPGAKDDQELATRAKNDFTALKKSLKAVVGTQSSRLELALATGRKWDRVGWKRLFVQNPIMHSFAIGLVWGVYREEALAESFRYMEDGSFNTVDEEELDFDALEGEVGLVHPLDLTEELLAQWREQLEDYEIRQPIPQLDRPVYRCAPEAADALALDLLGGKKMLGITLSGKLQKAGWYRGSVQDGGCFYTFYREIGELGAELLFSGMFVSPEPDQEITLGQVVFYRPRENRWDLKREEAVPLGQVPPRIFSELTLDLALASAASSERDEGWNGEHGLRFDNYYQWNK